MLLRSTSFLAVSFAMVTLSACDAQNKNATGGLFGAGASISSEDFFNEVAYTLKENPNLTAKAIAIIEKLSPEAYLNRLLANSSDNAIRIDSYTIANAKSKLALNRSSILFMNQKYASVGDMWRDMNYRPLELNLNKFITAVRASASSQSNLALVNDIRRSV